MVCGQQIALVISQNIGQELTHSDLVGDIFGRRFTDAQDAYPVLAHSNFSDTWPKEYNAVTGEYERVWPGWW